MPETRISFVMLKLMSRDLDVPLKIDMTEVEGVNFAHTVFCTK